MKWLGVPSIIQRFILVPRKCPVFFDNDLDSLWHFYFIPTSLRLPPLNDSIHSFSTFGYVKLRVLFISLHLFIVQVCHLFFTFIHVIIVEVVITLSHPPHRLSDEPRVLSAYDCHDFKWPFFSLFDVTPHGVFLCILVKNARAACY